MSDNTDKRSVRIIPPLNESEEPTVVTSHQIDTDAGPLSYEAHVGRLAIRNDETGEVVGYLGFQAYVVARRREERFRPLSFIWNGGPNSNSTLLHLKLLGPRLLRDNALIDNPETLLRYSDLVFYDPINTGFSRPTRQEYAQQFLTVLGDFAATTEFIRSYRACFACEEQPIFMIGESSGTWRAAGVLDTMAKRHQAVAGLVLISGAGGLTSTMPNAAQHVMYISARTAAAFALVRLPPDLMTDRDRAIRAADEWAWNTYLPALHTGVDRLGAIERDDLAAGLCRFTGVPPESINKNTLVMSNLEFRKTLLRDSAQVLNMYDMRRFDSFEPLRSPTIGCYLRRELGYQTGIAYTPVEDGYMPKPGPDRRDNLRLWRYDHAPNAQAVFLENIKEGAGPPPALFWLRDGMSADPDVRVFIATGRYDSLNGYEGNLRAAELLPAQLSARITQRCYEGGHMMYYYSDDVRKELSHDVAEFILATGGRTHRPE
jgi:carboxypeptidase C (cathepsin A)